MNTLSLPYPVSANRFWRYFRGKTFRSAEATKFSAAVKQIAMVANLNPICRKQPVLLTLIFHPKLTKQGGASETRQDLSTTIKVVEDALQGTLYENDKQIVFIFAEIEAPIEGGGLTVKVKSKG